MTMTTTNLNSSADKRVAFLAPHLEWPVRNGADRYVFELACALSMRVDGVTVVASSSILDFKEGRVCHERSATSSPRSKLAAGIRALILRSHYLMEKFVSPAYVKAATDLIIGEEYDWIVFSFPSSTGQDLLHRTGCVRLVLTHNDEFAWFEQRAHESGVLGQIAAKNSIRWLERFVTSVPDEVRFAHVNQSDALGWQERGLGGVQGIVPVGVRMPDAHAAEPVPASVPTALFVGSLGVQMNVDALFHFGQTYAPALRARVPSLVVHLVGSNPSRRLLQFATSQGWRVSANVTDAELHAAIRSATVTILPFKNAVGAKLKLIESLAFGIPVLSTRSGAGALSELPAPSVVSDHAEAWANGIASIVASGVSDEEREAHRSIAANHSWARSAEALIHLMGSVPAV